MRNNQPITQQEFSFPEEQRLISATDLHGKIIYCNPAFIEVSGYEYAELLQAPHNMIRHPDVPSAVFAHMWQTLKAGRPWMGIVKNRRKNGDHYWVNAYVTPVYNEQRQITGYESVRSKPSANQIRRARALYARLNAGKTAPPLSRRLLPVMTQWFPFIIISQSCFLLGVWLSHYWGFFLAGLLSIPLGLASLYWQQRGMRRLLKLAEQNTSDALLAQMYTDQGGPEARLEMAMISQKAHLRTCLTRLQDSASRVSSQARETDTLSRQCSRSLSNQQQEIEQIAAAMNQMSAATHEIANSVGQTAAASQDVSNLADRSLEIAEETRQVMRQLSGAVARTHEVVGLLEQDSDAIGSVVDVIRGIAEQTNLLALNAAIEAARAGDNGRGFAVVADEVRQLAQRTTQSTEQIHSLIAKLQQQAKQAVQITQGSNRHVEAGVQEMAQVDDALAGISTAIDSIRDMATQIASASEEQSMVAEEITRNITNIAAIAQENTESVANTSQLSDGLSATAGEQYLLVERFNR